MNIKKVFTCIGLLLGMSISTLMQTQLTTAMPVISNEFGTTDYYSWVYTGYMLASSVSIPFFGWICERYGHRKNYIVGGLIFFLGILFSGLSYNMITLILSRVVMGIGAGIVVPATYGIISTVFKKEDMRKVFGLMAIIQIINKGLGSVLGGIFSTYFTWRLGLFILLPITFLGIMLVVATIKDEGRMKNDAAIDILSAALLALALLITMYGLEKSSSALSTVNVLILLVGIALITFFTFREHKKENGILPVEIIKSAKLKGLLIQVLLMGAVLNICFAYLPMYMVQVFGWSTVTSGNVLLLYILTMGVASSIFAFVKVNENKLITLGWVSFLIGSIGGVISYVTAFAGIFYISNILLGLGVGILSSVILGAMQVEISANEASTNGIAHLMRNIGGTLGVAMLQVCLISDMWLLFAGLLLLGTIAMGIQLIFVSKRRVH